jgi:hypothetical protein
MTGTSSGCVRVALNCAARTPKSRIWRARCDASAGVCSRGWGRLRLNRSSPVLMISRVRRSAWRAQLVRSMQRPLQKWKPQHGAQNAATSMTERHEQHLDLLSLTPAKGVVTLMSFWPARRSDRAKTPAAFSGLHEMEGLRRIVHLLCELASISLLNPELTQWKRLVMPNSIQG